MEIRTVSIADSVFSEIEEKILCGAYKIGEHLTEIRLSEEYGVSRTPIREAIRRLEQENLVESRGKGVTVLGVSRSDLEDIYEVRMRIEGLAAKRAAEKITPDELSKLEEALELQEFYTERRTPDKIRNADSSFHDIIYTACRSETLTSILKTLHKKTQMYRKISVESAERAEMATKEHRDILSAIKNKDGALAEKLAILHIENARKNITEKLFGVN